MPPQPGLFSVSYGATHIQSQGGIATASASTAPMGPAIIGPGIGIATTKGSAKAMAASSSAHSFGAAPGADMLNGGDVYHHHGAVNGHMPHPGTIGHGHPGHVAHQHPNNSQGAGMPGPSNRTYPTNPDDTRKEKKRKDVSSKVGREMSDRRDDGGRLYTESVTAYLQVASILATRPELNPMFRLRLYPLTIERSSLLAQFENEERYAVECAQVAYEEERQRVEDEWKKGRERVRERLLEGIEERRKKAREEKESEGAVGDASLDVHSRQPITRKLRNKLGTSPPPTPLATAAMLPNGAHSHHTSNPIPGGSNGNLAITTGPFLNPHSLSVDEIPSPFPLPLTSTSIPNASNGSRQDGNSATAGVGPGGGPGGKRRPKGTAGGKQAEFGAFAKHMNVLTVVKESEVENDLGEIRRGNKRRRAATAAAAANKAAGAS